MPRAMRSLMDWKDWNPEEIKELLKFAQIIEKDRFRYQGFLQNRTLVMLFQKTSTRTRVSFEAGITELGGHAIFLDWESSNFKLSRISFETHYLSKNSDLIMARMKKNSDLQDMISASTVPVINGCCDKYHPCQAMADMLTIASSQAKTIEGTRLTYIGVHNNVVNSLMSICSALEVHLTLVCPTAQFVDEHSREQIRSKGLLTETLDLAEAVQNADYVYTDTWVDMEFFNDPDYQKEKDERLKLMMPYQINKKLMEASNAKIMHDMPIHPGYEISEDMVYDDRSIIFDQAANRLIAQKAIMITLLGMNHQ